MKRILIGALTRALSAKSGHGRRLKRRLLLTLGVFVLILGAGLAALLAGGVWATQAALQAFQSKPILHAPVGSEGEQTTGESQCRVAVNNLLASDRLPVELALDKARESCAPIVPEALHGVKAAGVALCQAETILGGSCLAALNGTRQLTRIAIDLARSFRQPKGIREEPLGNNI